MKANYKLLLGCFALLLAAFLIPAGCKKKDHTAKMQFSVADPVPAPPTPTVAPSNDLPKVSTDSVISIGTTTVICGADLISSGSSSVSAKGVCWSTQPDPTLSNSSLLIGSGMGAYQGMLRALVPGTKYYARAYATNSAGTAYGNNRVFTTLANAAGTATDADGNIYHSIKIGRQEWLLENLRTTTYLNGDPIPHIENDASWNQDIKGAYSYFNYDDRTVTDFGLFYNFFVLEDSRKIAPQGWHLPSRAEWDTLAKFLGGSSVAGGKLKDVTGWNAPNTGATNESGFSAKGRGLRQPQGASQNVGAFEFFWIPEPISGNMGNMAQLRTLSADFIINTAFKNAGCHIRCIKD